MSTKGTIIRPVTKSCGSDAPLTPAIDKVNKILDADPNNIIDPESALYQDAVAEYNDAKKKGTLVRLAIPSTFCGYVDPVTGIFSVIPKPPEIPLDPNQPVKTAEDEITDIPELTPISYPSDVCLQKGLPGSKPYAECLANTEDEAYGPSGIKWDFSDLEILQEMTPDWDATPPPPVGSYVRGEAGAYWQVQAGNTYSEFLGFDRTIAGERTYVIDHFKPNRNRPLHHR